MVIKEVVRQTGSIPDRQEVVRQEVIRQEVFQLDGKWSTDRDGQSDKKYSRQTGSGQTGSGQSDRKYSRQTGSGQTGSIPDRQEVVNRQEVVQTDRKYSRQTESGLLQE